MESMEQYREAWIKSSQEHILHYGLEPGQNVRVASYNLTDGPGVGGKDVLLLSVNVESSHACNALVEDDDGVLYRVRIEDVYPPRGK